MLPAGAFLQPTLEQQAALKAKDEEAKKQKKAKAKVEAAKRKRKRAEDAARVEAIALHIVRNRSLASPPPQPIVAEDRSVAKVQAYLASPPYFGRSEIADKERIKELCGDGQRVWDKERKMWGTRLAGYLENLVNSGKWTPFGIEEEWLPRFVAAARERTAQELAHAEAVVNVKWENSNAEIREAQAAAEEGGTAHLNVEQRAAASKAREADELMIDATAEEVNACAQLGFGETAVVASRYWPELGPRSGMSDEGRLLRWVELARSDRRCDFERVPAVLWNPVELQRHLAAVVAQLVAECNARARLAAFAR